MVYKEERDQSSRGGRLPPVTLEEGNYYEGRASQCGGKGSGWGNDSGKERRRERKSFLLLQVAEGKAAKKWGWKGGKSAWLRLGRRSPGTLKGRGVQSGKKICPQRRGVNR